MGTLVGTGGSAPAVVAGEPAEAQPDVSPVVPTSIPVPTATQQARAEHIQAVALKTIDGLAALDDIKADLAGDTFTGDVHLAQTKAIVADGSGCTMTGTWGIAGYSTFRDAETALATNVTGTPSETLSGSGTRSSAAYVEFTSALAGDRALVDITLDATATCSGAVYAKIVAVEDYGGAGTERTMSGAIMAIDTTGGVEGARLRVALTGRHTVITAGTLRFYLAVDTGGGDSFNSYGGGGVRGQLRHTF